VKRRSWLAAVLTCAFAVAALPAVAQFGLPKLPGGGSPADAVRDAAINRALAEFANTILPDIPILSSANALYPTVASLPGDAFRPKPLLGIGERLRTSTGGVISLEAGDYALDVDVFCMKVSAHSPTGRRYLLAPLRGAAADVIATLNARAVTSGIDHRLLQVLSWDIQSGLGYDEMPATMRGIVDRLLPEFRARLHGNVLQTMRARFDSTVGKLPGAPSFDSALTRLGDPGRAILALRDAHDRLVRLGADPDAAIRELIQTGASGGVAGGASTPWSRISERVYARLITDGDFSTPATYQIRVVASVARVASVGPLRLLAATPPAHVTVTPVVGEPQDSGVQPLTQAPRQSGPAPRPTPTRHVDTPHPSHSKLVPTNEKEIPVSSCAAAVAFLASNPDDVGIAKSILAPTIAPNPPVPVKQADGTYKAKAAITWAIDKSQSSITMPYFTWPDMTEAEAAALRAYYQALLVHEDGHVTVAAELGKTISVSLTGSGATPAAAVADFKSLVQSRAAKNGADIAQRDADYDNATNHGATQSDGPSYGFPGGSNVVLACP